MTAVKTAIPISNFFSAACVKCPIAGNSNCSSFSAAVGAGYKVDDVKEYVSSAQEGVKLADGCASSDPVSPDDGP